LKEAELAANFASQPAYVKPNNFYARNPALDSQACLPAKQGVEFNESRIF
jgi:hypothetical protein